MPFGKRLATEASSSPFKEWSLDYKAMKKVLKEWEKATLPQSPQTKVKTIARIGKLLCEGLERGSAGIAKAIQHLHTLKRDARLEYLDSVERFVLLVRKPPEHF